VYKRILNAITPIVIMPLVASCSSGVKVGDVISADNAVRLERISYLDLPSSFVNAVVFSPDSRYLITGDRNEEVIVWERETWNRRIHHTAESNLRADDEAQVGFYGTLALSPDGRAIVSASADGVRVRDWDGNELYAISYGARVYSAAISPNGRLLAVGGVSDNIKIIDFETGQEVADLRSDREFISVLVFSPDGEVLLAGYERPQNVMSTWNTTNWQETSTFSHVAERFDYHDAIFTPDGRNLVIASTRNHLEFLDMTTKQVARILRGHARAPYQLAFSPDGSVLASAAEDGTVRLWNVETGDILKVIENAPRAVFSVAFSPDGTLLAFGVEEEGVEIWAVGSQSKRA
jgi:WD40 repeat protein